jgi:CBS-domain-containing membrane protein
MTNDNYITHVLKAVKKTPWPESASELYRLSDSRLSAKLVPTFADGGCHVVSVTDSYGRILGFLDRSRYFFSQAAPQLCSRG